MGMPPSGSVTFLFTDIEGSTKLAQEHPDRLPVLLARHDEILHRAISEHNGYVFQHVGDSFCASFSQAAEALSAALEAQQHLLQEAWSPAPVKVRMGIHTGPAELESDTGKIQYSGYTTLALTQRIMSAGHGGQVLLSHATHELLKDGLPPQIQFIDQGECRLKDVLRNVRLYQLAAPGLPSDFPPLNTLEILSNNLPAQLTTFIGREKEVDEIKKSIAASRMVTLTGSGGAGKTRLSLQVATDSLSRFSNGVWLVELAPVSDPGLVPQTILSIFNLREDRHRTPLDVLIDYLRNRTILLLLDNCEHLVGACAQVSEKLLLACPRLKILATSREALGIAGEVSYRVPSMKIPDPANIQSLHQLKRLDSIRLFSERARTAKPDFELTEENASFVAQICSRLDGIPLAIELAASRVRMLTAEQIAARLDDRFRLLTGGSRTALPRQRTLRAAIDWSYSLLSDEEKTLFRRLAVFVGGWTLEAAESVCGEETGVYDILDLLTRLVDKSLVIVEEARCGIRYHRLETIRQYSRERFHETDEVEEIKSRHLDYFVQFAEQVDDKLKSGDQVVWQERMEQEQDNLRTALDWSLNRNPDAALRIVGAANLFWTAGGYSAEGFRWTQKALEQVAKIPLAEGSTTGQRQAARAKALSGLTRLYLSLGDNLNAKRVAEESVALYRQSQDPRGLSFALVILAYPLEFLSELEQAEAALHESYAIARDAGDVYLICRALNRLAGVILALYHDLDLSQGYVEESIRLARDAGLRSQAAQAAEMLGHIASQRRNFDEARSRFRESLQAYQEIGASFNALLEKSNLAHLERKLGNYQEALAYYRETIPAFRDIGQTGAVAHQLECFGFIAIAQGQNERAMQLLAAATSLREQASTPMRPEEKIHFDQQLKILREKMNSPTLEWIWTKTHALSLDDAIALAVEEEYD